MVGVGLRRAIVAALLVGTVLVGGAPARSGQAAGESLRVGYFPNVTHAQAVLGFGQGTFAKRLNGVTVTGQVFNAGPDEMNSIFAGAIDIGYIGPGPAITGFVRSHGGIVIVAGAASGGSELVARAGSGITGVKGLAGKTVAIPQLGNTQDILLRALLKDNGLASSESGGSVKIVAVQNPDTLTLFKKGVLDAALVPEPWGSRLIAQTGARVVLDWNQIYGGRTPATVVVVAAPFLKAHRDLVVRFLRVHDELTKDLQDRAAVYAPLYTQLEKLTGKGIPSGVLAMSLRKTVFTTAIDSGGLTQFAGFSVAAGYLKKGSSLNGLVDPWPLAHLNDASIK